MIVNLRLPQVLQARGRSRSSHYADVADGLFTTPVKVGPRASAWPDYEVDALVRARIAGKNDGEIRVLVSELMAARAGLDHECRRGFSSERI